MKNSRAKGKEQQKNGSTDFVIRDGVAKGLNGLNVKMIGGLVEDKKIGPMCTQNGKSHSGFLSSGKAGNLGERRIKNYDEDKVWERSEEEKKATCLFPEKHILQGMN